MRLFSTEQVSKWHPDKYADQISDAILTECLREDPNAHCGIETLVKNDAIVLAGEMTTSAKVEPADIARRVADKLGYPVGKVVNLISSQSPEIKNAVDSCEEIGAGDQGIIDAGYSGSIKVKLYNNSIVPYEILRGDKITQLVVLPVVLDEIEVVDAVHGYERGDAGIGSTGR